MLANCATPAAPDWLGCKSVADQIYREIAVTISLASPPVSAAPQRMRRYERKRLRRALAEHDRHAARIAELDHMSAVLDRAADLVADGWVQHVWFACADQSGRRRLISAYNLHVLTGATVTGACLVGAIVHAAGGPKAAHTQLVQRTLDLTWHTLYRAGDEPVHWCPAPSMRAVQLRDLTRWNDDPGRTATDVTTLLGATRDAAVDLRHGRGTEDAAPASGRQGERLRR